VLASQHRPLRDGLRLARHGALIALHAVSAQEQPVRREYLAAFHDVNVADDKVKHRTRRLTPAAHNPHTPLLAVSCEGVKGALLAVVLHGAHEHYHQDGCHNRATLDNIRFLMCNHDRKHERNYGRDGEEEQGDVFGSLQQDAPKRANLALVNESGAKPLSQALDCTCLETTPHICADFARQALHTRQLFQLLEILVTDECGPPRTFTIGGSWMWFGSHPEPRSVRDV